MFELQKCTCYHTYDGVYDNATTHLPRDFFYKLLHWLMSTTAFCSFSSKSAVLHRCKSEEWMKCRYVNAIQIIMNHMHLVTQI